MITPEKLAELEKLHSAATPGDWSEQRYINYQGWSIYSDTEGCIAERWYSSKLDSEVPRNGLYIASLHNAFPELLATIREQEDRSTRIYNALRQVIIAAGGIADPGVSDDFLIEYAPKEMAAIKAKL